MSSFEEETYSTIFTSLKHPVRRKILRMLSGKPRNFSEMLEALGISSSHLTYHLENLGELVSKTENGKYKISTFGEAAVGTMSKVEEAPKVTRLKHLPWLPIKWKSLFVLLTIGLVVLAGVSYTQYQSFNRLSSQYEELKELIALTETEGTSLQSEHILSLKLNNDDLRAEIHGSPYCFVYSPHDNSTLHLVLTKSTLSESYITISVQDVSIFDLSTREAGTVIWSVRATSSSTYSVPLASKGWYTISLVGPIIKMNNTVVVTMEVTEDIDCRMSLRLIYEGEHASFIVKPTFFH
jgi:DNA-binding transcriptional ArsR family regulator